EKRAGISSGAVSDVILSEAKNLSVNPNARYFVRSLAVTRDDRLTQASVFFACAVLLHCPFSCANCSAERIPLAWLRNVCLLSLVQPAFMHSACQASILAF